MADNDEDDLHSIFSYNFSPCSTTKWISPESRYSLDFLTIPHEESVAVDQTISNLVKVSVTIKEHLQQELSFSDSPEDFGEDELLALSALGLCFKSGHEQQLPLPSNKTLEVRKALTSTDYMSSERVFLMHTPISTPPKTQSQKGLFYSTSKSSYETNIEKNAKKQSYTNPSSSHHFLCRNVGPVYMLDDMRKVGIKEFHPICLNYDPPNAGVCVAVVTRKKQKKRKENDTDDSTPGSSNSSVDNGNAKCFEVVALECWVIFTV